MPTTPSVKPSQKAVKTYYEALGRYAQQNVDHESAVRSAFQNLLDQTGRRFGWTLIPELSEEADGHRVQPDGTFRDDFHIRRGHWEAFFAHTEPAHEDFNKAIDEFQQRVPELGVHCRSRK